MSKLSYYELLKHPNWQRKRLEVMERAGFECKNCGADDLTLNIHHGYYEKNLLPWEYPDESLHCLCEPCHKKITDTTKELNRMLGRLSEIDLKRIMGYIQAFTADLEEGTIKIVDYAMAEGAGDFFNIAPEEVIRSLDENGVTTALDLDSIAGILETQGITHRAR